MKIMLSLKSDDPKQIIAMISDNAKESKLKSKPSLRMNEDERGSECQKCRGRLSSGDLNNDFCDIVLWRVLTGKHSNGTIKAFSKFMG